VQRSGGSFGDVDVNVDVTFRSSSSVRKYFFPFIVHEIIITFFL